MKLTGSFENILTIRMLQFDRSNTLTRNFIDNN